MKCLPGSRVFSLFILSGYKDSLYMRAVSLFAYLASFIQYLLSSTLIIFLIGKYSPIIFTYSPLCLLLVYPFTLGSAYAFYILIVDRVSCVTLSLPSSP